METKVFVLIASLLLLFCGLLAQETEYLEIEPTDMVGGGLENQAAGNRIPLIFIAITVGIAAIVLYHYVLNSIFDKCLVSGDSPESAAAKCLIKWVAWVGIITLIFIGIDIINMDFNNVWEHLLNSIVRIIIIIFLFILASLIISSHKGKNIGGHNG